MNQEEDRWLNRRRMAWLSVLAGMSFPALLLVTESDQLGELAWPFYTFISAVAGAYIGFATIDDKWQRNVRSPRHRGVVETAHKYDDFDL